MSKRDWHNQQIRNDKRVFISLKYIIKLLNSDLLASNMEVTDLDKLRTISKDINKMAAKYDREDHR